MRFPFSLTRQMTSYLLRKKLTGEKIFPLVLMLEPLHACNLRCSGCGRIREYAGTMNRRLSVAACLEAVKECGAPIVSLCGGEPLIYPEIGELIEKLIQRKKHIYLCTNGLMLEKKLPDLPRNKRLMINVHLDGMETTHDRIVERQGVFEAAVRGIKAAKAAGYAVCTNTTIYKETDMHEIAVLFAYLTELEVDGLMISPAYGYEAVQCSLPDRGANIFMTKAEIHEKFRAAKAMLGRFKLTASPIYLDFLRGERELPCAAWANPTYNVRGWRAPCYLRGEMHYESYLMLAEATDWDALGPGKDPKCEHCLVHCGFEPAAVLRSDGGLRDLLKMAVWQLS
ncbi:MAG: adenosyl-hopene transferase HpnH [Pirellulales bacterium]|nr:adenosyl-hopene transferase HpnH [Pirellulales bacterium]